MLKRLKHLNLFILMPKQLKNISFIMLVLVFLAPSIVKFEHHHKEFHCNAKNEKHFHNYHEKCNICQFDFSLFTNNESVSYTKTQTLSDSYTNQYTSVTIANYSEFSFLMRAPPAII
jgi:hypothetical protein